MKILALSDRAMETIYSEHVRQRYGDVDLVVGCGDLPYYYLEYVVSMLNRPTYFVRGNHDTGIQHTSDGRRLTGPEGAESIDDRVTCIGGLLFMGLGGSIRYRPDAEQQFTEAQMRARIRRLLPDLLFNRVQHGRYVDVVVTHSPPYQIHDRTDRAHIGFRAFLTLMSRFKPRYLLHGHTHVWRNNDVRETVFEATRVVNVYPASVLEIGPPEESR